ncbi:thioredoxin family protein [Sulfurimonas sp. MAG313]|nr:thioredoxin family protein [Sulfurimonas sp. MAG313]MDF1880078.1 thioredoxin family protein [Sulfurimonas sp. MAG313]
MTIEIYKSSLCPRCAYAHHTLKKLQDEFNDIEIISYDIVTNLSAFKKAGIKMIPCIKINSQKKSWIIPKASEIKIFVLENR